MISLRVGSGILLVDAYRDTHLNFGLKASDERSFALVWEKTFIMKLIFLLVVLSVVAAVCCEETAPEVPPDEPRIFPMPCNCEKGLKCVLVKKDPMTYKCLKPDKNHRGQTVEEE